jgi:hypothetical protein
LLSACALALSTALGASSAPAAPPTGRAVSGGVREAVLAQYPDAVFPPAEADMCSPVEHSYYGPTNYCFAEFTTGETWNMVEVSLRPVYVPPDPAGGDKIYGHGSWRREWVSCKLPPRAPVKLHGHDRLARVPGALISNEDCGLGMPEQVLRPETDSDLFLFEAWPRIRGRRPLRAVSRAFIFAGVAPGIARYRVSKSGGVYTFTNALGDSFKYGPRAALDQLLGTS